MNEKMWKKWHPYELSDLIHNYAMRYADRNARQIDYGTGDIHTSVEVHVLEKIYLHPGITVTELAEITSRTKGAISQIVKKLIIKNLVMKSPKISGDRKQLLYATDDGMKLSKLHMEYDERHTIEFFAKVAENYSDKQINDFFEIMHTCFDLLNPKNNYPWN